MLGDFLATFEVLRNFCSVRNFEQPLGNLSEFVEPQMNVYIFRGYRVQPQLYNKKLFKKWNAFHFVFDSVVRAPTKRTESYSSYSPRNLSSISSGCPLRSGFAILFPMNIYFLLNFGSKKFYHVKQPSALFNKLMSVFYASVPLLMINCVITLSKPPYGLETSAEEKDTYNNTNANTSTITNWIRILKRPSHDKLAKVGKLV